MCVCVCVFVRHRKRSVHCTQRVHPYLLLLSLSLLFSNEIQKRQALLEKTRKSEQEARAADARNARRHPGLARRRTTKAMELRQKALIAEQEKLAVQAAKDRARRKAQRENDKKMAAAIRRAMEETSSSSPTSGGGKTLADLHVGDGDARSRCVRHSRPLLLLIQVQMLFRHTLTSSSSPLTHTHTTLPSFLPAAHE